MGAITCKNTIHKTIQSSGGRLTKIKKAIIDVLSQNHCLLLKHELVAKLKDKKIKPDRSTIYRELQFLTKNNIIIKNTIAGVDYYEIPKDHHHHLVCLKCNKIKSFNISKCNLILHKLKTKILGFAEIKNHSFELFGICNSCYKK